MSSSTVPPEFQNREIRMGGNYAISQKIYLKDALVDEGLSKITKIRLEIVSFDKTVTPENFLGEKIWVIYKDENDVDYHFSGICISIEDVGRYQGGLLFVAELRSWLWMLKRVRDNRVFQEKTAVEIIREVFDDNGFSANYRLALSGTYDTRTYCIQYRESCFDFVSRLMEEEGIYYFFEQDGTQEKMVLADSLNAHSNPPNGVEFPFYYPDNSNRDQDHVSAWVSAEHVRGGKVTMRDWNFETPASDLQSVKQILSGGHSYNSYEHYDYPGHYRDTSLGEKRVRVRMESIAAQYEVSKGVGNIRGMAVGQKFKLTDHPFVSDSVERLIRNAQHYIGVDSDYETEEVTDPVISRKRAKPKDMEKTSMAYRCTFDAIPLDTPFRAPQTTHWPEIHGLHTAIVTGPSSEEIYTDEYGRIKVQFHWDRVGQRDENTSCFVRVVMPWTGENWGMISIPRIGQEVVIQFEEGNPDRPICTGMLYNQQTMPPYALPANKTETGIVTRSTKEGNANTFHELIFKDEKNSEEIRFQSERDYNQIIKNNAVITIGMEHADPGDMTQTIKNDRTETVKEGNHTFLVETGNETYTIEGNQDITVNGNETFTIGGDQTTTIGGAQTTDVGGNQDMTVGGSTTHTTSGSTTIQANQKIELKCGNSTIKIEPAKITLSSIQVEMSGSAQVKVSGTMVDIAGSGMLKLTGGIIKIN